MSEGLFLAVALRAQVREKQPGEVCRQRRDKIPLAAAREQIGVDRGQVRGSSQQSRQEVESSGQGGLQERVQGEPRGLPVDGCGVDVPGVGAR